MPHVQTLLKFERPHRMANVTMEARQPVASARYPMGPQQARPIHPEHIKQIINTVDQHALQKVLLELCQMSPALSGALVRGLAPHSASAQGMVSQHQMRSQQPRVQISDDEDSDDLYEATKKKLVKSVLSTPVRSMLPTQFGGDGGSRAIPQPHSSQLAPRVKREPRERPGSGSDGDLRLPGAYPRTAPHPTPIRTPIRKPSTHSSIVGQTPRLLTRVTPQSMSINKAPVSAVKTCTVCCESFVDVNAPCISHSGQRVRKEDGSTVWSCCEEDIGDPGCVFYGQHVTGEGPEEEAFVQRKRPSVSPGPNRASQKRPRAF
jgi:hypothetical protein